MQSLPETYLTLSRFGAAILAGPFMVRKPCHIGF
jgi:hypothetical protein